MSTNKKPDATDEQVSRRSLLKGGSALAGLTVLQMTGSALAFGEAGEEVIPWLDQPAPNPVPSVVGNLLEWESLDSRLTPADNFFFVSHYGQPQGLNESKWRLDIAGLVDRPRSLRMAELKALNQHDVEFTLECSGNTGLDFFIGGIGNARWGGTRLSPLLRQAGIQREASEVIFWGIDRGTVTVRDNSGIIRGGETGVVEPDPAGGLDLTITEQFARSMSVEEALCEDNLLCYEMNGVPLPREHGFPLRLIAPGWYGVANVKWLTRIEVVDRRYAGRFMSRDYVTIREEERAGETVWTFATVGQGRLKSAPAKVTRGRRGYRVMGAAWGAPIAAVEVQIDNGSWMPATLYTSQGHANWRGYAWRFWTFDWGNARSGEHTVRSRAIDVDGNIQPAPNAPSLTRKVTYWESNGQIARRVRLP
jgi:DMSO/TMAO reductase YedYZ molybdopterin-dependent catalytic subunit